MNKFILAILVTLSFTISSCSHFGHKCNHSEKCDKSSKSCKLKHKCKDKKNCKLCKKAKKCKLKKSSGKKCDLKNHKK